MSVTETKYAIAPQFPALESAVAALIALGFQPVGDVAHAGGMLTQRMDKSDAGQTEYDADGAIAVKNGTAVLTKGSAGAYTLAAPTAEQAGTRLRITNQTAFAHVVTSTGNLFDGAEATGDNTATFGAFPGSTIELEAVNERWNVVSVVAVTVA
jgi:hypothetical protein